MTKSQKKSNWYEDWFNSPYYHLLYKHRDEDEAKYFIDRFCGKMKITRGSKILDLGCGRGRHAVYLAKKGFEVTGIDISQQNIDYACNLGYDKISFCRHNMRDPFKKNHFDFVLNLFTSIGYFTAEEDNLRTIRSAAYALKKGGKLMIDFMNVTQVIRTLVKEETQIIESTRFYISRGFENGFIVKHIRVDTPEEKSTFEEKVRALMLSDFNLMFSKSGLKLSDVFGDYLLNPFDEKVSERLIMVCEKLYL